MKGIDWDRSKYIADVIDARQGECVANSVRAFLDYRDILPEDAVYVEGLYVYGGQSGPHAWIETNNAIIELSLVRETNIMLRETATHHKILTRSEDEIKKEYGSEPRSPGVRLMIIIAWDDPRVIRLLKEIDPTGSIDLPDEPNKT